MAVMEMMLVKQVKVAQKALSLKLRTRGIGKDEPDESPATEKPGESSMENDADEEDAEETDAKVESVFNKP